MLPLKGAYKTQNKDKMQEIVLHCLHFYGFALLLTSLHRPLIQVGHRPALHTLVL